MIETTWIYALDLCLASMALFLTFRLVQRKSALPPPGPPGWLLIGNLFDLRKQASYESLGAMSSDYGSVISLKVIGVRYVVLNSFKATKDLLEKRSAITSNRPHLTMAGDLIGWCNATAFLQYGDTCRRHRKFFHRQIGTKNSLELFYPAAEAEAKQFALHLLQDTDNLIAQCRRTAGSIVLKISHGYSIKDEHDPFLEMANKAMEMFSLTTTPGRFLVDILPMLRYLPGWFPGCGFHQDAIRWRKLLNETADMPYKFVLESLAKGDAAPSFTSRLLQEGVTPEDEEILKWASFSMYLGGSDTTPSTLSAFFLAMTIYPEILKKAQAEVDAIVGNERLPTIQDRGALAYVNAICTELLRWHVVTPLSPHIITQDTIYEGHFIPKGTCLFGNIWFILSNQETYPAPRVFNPERFLGENQQPDPRDVCFGWGRRSCPGRHLVELSIFICVATAIATLDVKRSIENGKEIIPRYEVEGDMLRHVKPFKCRIVPRSDKAEELLRA